MKKVEFSLGGIREMLSRDQMKLIIGGYEIPDGSSACFISGSRPDGSSYNTYISFPDYMHASCSQQISEANSNCVGRIESGYASSCRYNCGCDGI